MAYLAMATDQSGNGKVIFGGAQSDAFGRGRVSEPQTLFNVSFQYDAQPLLCQVLTVGAGTGAKTSNVSSMTLATGGNTNGDGAILQSHGYYRYEPGKSQAIVMTGVIGAAKANVRSQIGYYDANDGVFFDQNNGMNVTLRTHSSGSTVDTSVAQASWNLDKMDGSGVSGINLDFTKTQIFVIDLEWLGVGRIRFGFNIAGVTTYCHQILNANVNTLPYMNTANLPIRWEIHNTGTASGTTTMTAICGSIISEGGQNSPSALQFAASNGVTTINAANGVRTPLLSIRPKATFNSIVNRSRIRSFRVELANNGAQIVFWELVYNGALTGGVPTWTSVNGNSGVEFNIDSTACANGTVVAPGFVPGGSKANVDIPVDAKLALALDIAGTIADTLTICGASFGTAAASSASLTWSEER